MDFLDSLFSPTYSLGSSGANSIASGVNEYGLSLGLPPTITNYMGAEAGNYASGLMGTLPGQNGAPVVSGGGTSAPNTSGASSFQQKLACWNAQNLLYATPADTAACNSSSSTVVQASTDAANKANAVFGQWWANLTFSGVITAVLGVGMVIGALYLFGSASLSDAIANAVKGK